MSRIKPRTHGKELVRHITRLDRQNHETLVAYAQFLGEPTDYILNQLVQTILAKDKEFVAWRAQHSESPKASQTRTTGGTTNVPARTAESTQKSAATSAVTAR
jgi:tryptophan 2,3-dioxygenase